MKKIKLIKKVKINKMRRFTFEVVLSGVGCTKDEAWQDAVEQFELDPGSAPNVYTTGEEI